MKDEFLPNHKNEGEWEIEFSCWQSMGKSQKSRKPPQPSNPAGQKKVL